MKLMKHITNETSFQVIFIRKVAISNSLTSHAVGRFLFFLALSNDTWC